MNTLINTKDRIMQTAVSLIWTESYGSVSVEDICRQAGINKGSFYHFFPSKADLAVAAFENHWEQFRPVIDRIFSAQNPPLERFAQYFDLIYQSQKEKFEKYGFVCGCPFASIGTEKCVLDSKIRELTSSKIQAVIKYFTAAVRDAISEDLIDVKDIDVTVDEIYCYYIGALARARINNDLESLKLIKVRVFDLLGVIQKV